MPEIVDGPWKGSLPKQAGQVFVKNDFSYIVITPVRNEQERFQRTIDSLVAQTVRPARWIIVDDGSQDDTGALADRAAARHSWLRIVHRADRGFRKQGDGVMEAFYDGFNLVEGEPWDFLVKLDGDLRFGGDYFERCFARFAEDDQLGIGGGRIHCEVNGVAREDSPGDPSFHVRGATKIYRRACWTAIGGLVRQTGWDTLDELKANMLGWRTYSFPELAVLQLKSTGAADGSWRNWIKNGRANYITGYHPLFMLVKCASRAFRPPYGVGAAGLAWGYLSGYLRQAQQVDDPELVRFIRRQQINHLLCRESLWRNRSGGNGRRPGPAT